MGHIQIAEPCMGAIPAKADHAGLTVTVFGHNALGFVLVGLVFFSVLRIVVCGTVQEQDDVCVLFDGAGVTQVGQLRPVIRPPGRFLFFPLHGKAATGQ